MTTSQAYLLAKRTLDDRALDRRVLDRFARALGSDWRAEPGPLADDPVSFEVHPPDRPVEILEAGVGTGTMIARLAAWGVLPDKVRYRAIDRDAASVAVARDCLPTWLCEAGFEVTTDGSTVHAESPGTTLDVRLEVGDVFETTASADAVIASAFCDLIALPDDARRLLDRVRPGGLLYAPITYDGLTRFRPSHPAEQRVIAAYHDHMAAVRDQPGGPDAGRQLLAALERSQVDDLVVGGSDWIVRPNGDSYFADEDRVLAHVIETVNDAVREVPDGPTDALDSWLAARRAALDDARLGLVAHNLDVLAVRSGPG